MTNPALPSNPKEAAVWKYVMAHGPVTPVQLRRRFASAKSAIEMSPQVVRDVSRACLRKGLLITDPLGLVYTAQPYGFA
jgi:hypothetical protein